MIAFGASGDQRQGPHTPPTLVRQNRLGATLLMTVFMTLFNPTRNPRFQVVRATEYTIPIAPLI